MSYFNSNITGGSGGAAGGLVTKFIKTITISSSALAEVTIDISSDISNYKDVTNDRIIIELNDASAIAAGDAKLTHTYDAETGIITITSTNSSIPFASSSAVELSVNVYVAGAVQIPPAPPEPDLPDSFTITLLNRTKGSLTGSTDVNGNVFIPPQYKYYTSSGGYCKLGEMSPTAPTKSAIPKTENNLYNWTKNFGGTAFGTQTYTFYKKLE